MLNTVTEKCVGCELCKNICPTGAIDMKSGSCGYKYPVVDVSKCIKCDKCNQYCPVNVSNEKKEIISVFSAYVRNEADLKVRTSGGIATELAQYFIENEGIVYGVGYSKDYKKAYHLRVDNIEGVKQILGTKYVQANMNDSYLKIKSDLDEGRNVLFIGLPCEVAAVNRVVGAGFHNLFLCELVCHGPASPKTLKEYVEYLENKMHSKIRHLNVRYKKNGWRVPFLRAEFENGRVYCKEFYNTEYGYAFYLQGRESCYNCQYKGAYSKADVTLGDYWGISQNDEMYNPDGVSVVICHTIKAENLLSSLKSIKLKSISLEEALVNNEDIVSSRIHHKDTLRFEKIYNMNGLIKSLFIIKSVKGKIYNYSFTGKDALY